MKEALYFYFNLYLAFQDMKTWKWSETINDLENESSLMENFYYTSKEFPRTIKVEKVLWLLQQLK